PASGSTPILVAKQEPPANFTPFTDADVKRIAALRTDDQIEEVRKELKKRNPEFNGTLTPTIENEVVTGLTFFTDRITDISPVRALPRLTALDCRGGRVRGTFADLTPLKGMQLNKLNCEVT